jgi:CRISPR-associated protein Cmr2
MAYAAMRDGWARLADEILRLLADLAIDPTQLKRQLDWLEIYWASVECPDVTSSDADALQSWAASTCAPDANFQRLIAELAVHRSWRPNLGTYYGPIHSALGELHASRKLLREFGVVEEPGHKCTLCGIREPLRPQTLDASEYGSLTKWWKDVGSRLDTDGESGGRERLCAVCAAKRLSGRVFHKSLGIASRFPSTSEIAATTFKLSVLGAALKGGPGGVRAALRAFAETSQPLWESETEAYVVPATERQMRQLTQVEARAEKYWHGFAHLDGEWLFTERYAAASRATSGHGSRLTPSQISEMNNALVRLHKAAARTGIAPPSPYYAVLMFDGDRMGDWVAGRHPGLPQVKELLHPDIAPEELAEGYNALGSLKRPQSPALQGALSAALLGFACDVSRFAVERAPGSEGVVVYSGGDDVLAFAPISSALQTACLLRRLFSEPVLIERDEKVYHGDDATRRWGRNGRVHLGMGGRATASAGIAIAHHLQPLSQVLEAARTAERRAKDALRRDALSVTLLKRSGEQIEAGAKWEDAAKLSELVHMFSSARLSPRFVHQLAEEAPTLAGLPPELQNSETGRLLQRHLQGKDAVAPLMESFRALFATYGLQRSLGLLSLAAFIGRHSSAEVAP